MFELSQSNKRQSRKTYCKDFLSRIQAILFSQGVAKLFPQPKLVLPEDKTKSLIPDFVCQPDVSPQLGTRWRILDLKLPDVPVMKANSFHQTFTASIVDAFQQLHDYYSFFGRDDSASKAELFKHFAFHPKNPRLAVLIGRSSTVYQDAFDKASAAFPSVEIITYDEVLQQQYLRIREYWDWITKIT